MKIDMMRFYTRTNEQGCIETACVLRISENKTNYSSIGIAKQNPIDKHNEYIGRKTAITKSILRFKKKDNRRLIWQYFHDNFPKPETQWVKVSDNASVIIDEPPTDYIFDNLDEKYRETVEAIIKSGGTCSNLGIFCQADCPFYDCAKKYLFDLAYFAGEVGNERTLSFANSYLRQLDAKRDDKPLSITVTQIKFGGYVVGNHLEYKYQINFKSKTHFDLDNIGNTLIDTLEEMK